MSSQLTELLRPGSISMMFQPIVRVFRDRELLVALEALARGPQGTNMEDGDLMFAYARRKNSEVVLDQHCIGTALESAAAIPGSPILCLNVHAKTLTTVSDFTEWLTSRAAGAGILPSNLVLAIVAHTRVWQLKNLEFALARLRAAGVRIAVDGVGLGGANYQMLIECRPDYLKLDRYVVQGCGTDLYRRAILRATAEMANSSKSTLVAEGVERKDDMATLLDLGIDVMQGFLIAEPMATDALLDGRFFNRNKPMSMKGDSVAEV